MISFGNLRSLTSVARSKLSLIFFFLGLAISIASCAGYAVNYIPATYQFGLIQMLPSLFWFGFALCLFSLTEGINKDTERAFFIKIFLVCMLIWNIPTLFLKYPYAPGSYMHILEASPIMMSGYVPSASEVLSYLFNYYPVSFPGYHILLTSIFQVTNIAPLEFAKYYPVFSSAVTFLAIWLFFKTFLPSASYRWALLIAVLANVYMQFHVSPQSVGLIIGLLTLIALEKADPRWRAVAVLLFAYITISHPTTAFIVLSAAGLAWLLRIGLVRGKKILAEPVPLLVVCWLAWSFLYGSPFQQSVTELASTPLTTPTAPVTGIVLLDVWIAQAAARLTGVFFWAPRMRLIVLGVFATGSVYYLVHQWLNGRPHRQRQLITYTAFLVAPVLMVLIDITFLGRPAQLHDRYLLFFMLVTPVLLIRLAEDIKHPALTNSIQNCPADNSAAKSNKVKPKRPTSILRSVFLSVLLVLALFNFATVYYQSSLLITSDETISASDFVNGNSSTQVIGGQLIPDLANPYKSAILRQSQFYHLYPKSLSSLASPSVIVFDDYDRLRYQVWHGIDKYDYYAQSNEPEDALGKIYCNKRYDIYWFPGSGG